MEKYTETAKSHETILQGNKEAHLTYEVNDLLLGLVAGDPVVNVGDDVDADFTGQFIPDNHLSSIWDILRFDILHGQIISTPARECLHIIHNSTRNNRIPPPHSPPKYCQ